MPRSSKPAAPPDPTVDASPARTVTYPIRAVSRMSGVSIDTLRAWERRYAAVRPVRDERGRVYTDRDVRRIKLLRDAVAGGHAIGQVAHLDDEQLGQLAQVQAQATPHRRASNDAGPPSVIDTGRIIRALEKFDAATVETELARAATLLQTPDLMRDVLLPVLTEIGERWHSGRGRIAHEHMLSASVRNVLGSLLRVHQRSATPETLLFATPSGERHEFGTLGAALLAASGGLGTVYLGPDMPADDILAITNVVDLRAVVLGVSEHQDMAALDREVTQVARKLDADIELWLGGPAADRLARRLKGRALAIPSYDTLEQQLIRLGARY